MEMCILQTRTYWKVGIPWKLQTEMYQSIELKVYMRKIGVILLVMITPRIMVIKMSKMAHFMYFLLDTAKKISPSLGKIFTCIYKVLFCTFRKYYGLCTSDELLLVKFQRLEIQDFSIPLLTQTSFWYLSTISHEQLIPKPIDNKNIRSVILEIKNGRCKIVKISLILIKFYLLWKFSPQRERNISILTILHLSFLTSSMTLPILLFAIKLLARLSIFKLLAMQFSARNQYLSCALKYIALTVANFLLLSAENTKN